MSSKSLKQSIAQTFRPSSQRQSAILDGRLSFGSDRSTLNIDLPVQNLQPLKSNNVVTPVSEEDMIDLEDRAWGPPPPLKWNMPTFSRKRASRS